MKKKCARYKNRSKRKSIYNIEERKFPYFLLFYIILFIAIIIGFYKFSPEVIEFKMIMDEQQEQTIRDIVKDEINKANIERTKEEMNITTEQTIQENVSDGQLSEQSQPVIEQQPEVTSRSLAVPRSSNEFIEESIEQETITEVEEDDNILTGYDITSYYPGDGYQSTANTGSGKTPANFGTTQIGNKTVYTYQGKVVVAAATKELLKTGYSVKGSQNPQNKHYFRYYDTGKMKINGQWYDFIVLDSCGASMWEHYYRLDIFVPNGSNVVNAKNIEIKLD